MINSTWDIFVQTGKIKDYLNYKQIDINNFTKNGNFACINGELTDADNNRRSSDS